MDKEEKEELLRISDLIKKFLIKNGFKESNEFLFINDSCSILVTTEGYSIYFSEMSTYTQGHSIFCLIGILTYNGLMTKNYKQ